MISPNESLSVEVSGVTVSYPNGHVALRDASFQLHGGSICALVGVNGSGKSTLFKAIMGLVEPAAARCASPGGRCARR
jgi:manganese/iron transport system ATP-binding protein